MKRGSSPPSTALSSTREVPKSIDAVVDVVVGDGLVDYREIEPLIERTRYHQKYFTQMVEGKGSAPALLHFIS